MFFINLFMILLCVMVIQNQNLVRIRKQIMLVYLCWGKEENSNLRFLRCPTIPMEEYLES